METVKNPNTGELLHMLFSESRLEHFMNMDTHSVSLPPFHEYISALCKEKKEAPARIISRADLDKSFGHQLFTGRRKPSRDTILMLAFGFEADYELTQELLKVGRKSPLHPRVKRDMVLIFCLAHRYSIVDTQIALDTYGLPLLGERN